MDYYLDTKVLYKRSSFSGTLLRCLDGKEEKKCFMKFMKAFVQLMLVDIDG
jgi:hypothetical protein